MVFARYHIIRMVNSSVLPANRKNADYLDLVQSMLTPELMAIFGGANLDFATIGGFLGIEYLNLFWIFIVNGYNYLCCQ